VLAICAAIAPPASAQDTALTISSGAARTVDLRTAPEVSAVGQPAGLAINRPTMPMADYLTAKNAAAARSGASRPQSGATPPSTADVSLYTQVAGPNQAQSGGGFPPSGDIATSSQWMVQVVHNLVTMYNWNTNAFKQVSLATFFQDSTDFLFDPRVIYDPYWDRFVVLVGGLSPSNVLSPLWVGVSQTGDPSGAWLNYGLILTDFTSFADFPQLGMDLNSIIVTLLGLLGGRCQDIRDGQDLPVQREPVGLPCSGLGRVRLYSGAALCARQQRRRLHAGVLPERHPGLYRLADQ
jgi:hypothetical protein